MNDLCPITINIENNMILDIITIIISFVAVVFSVISFYNNKIRKKQEATIHAFDMLQAEIKERNTKELKYLWKYLKKDSLALIKEIQKDEWDFVTEQLALLEHFAVGINNKVYDSKILNSMAGNMMVDMWENIQPIIVRKRQGKGNKNNYREFENMIEKISKIRSRTERDNRAMIKKFFDKTTIKLKCNLVLLLIGLLVVLSIHIFHIKDFAIMSDLSIGLISGLLSSLIVSIVLKNIDEKRQNEFLFQKDIQSYHRYIFNIRNELDIGKRLNNYTFVQRVIEDEPILWSFENLSEESIKTKEEIRDYIDDLKEKIKNEKIFEKDEFDKIMSKLYQYGVWVLSFTNSKYF